MNWNHATSHVSKILSLRYWGSWLAFSNGLAQFLSILLFV